MMSSLKRSQNELTNSDLVRALEAEREIFGEEAALQPLRETARRPRVIRLETPQFREKATVLVASDRFRNPEESHLNLLVDPSGDLQGRADIRGQHREVIAEWMEDYIKLLRQTPDEN